LSNNAEEKGYKLKTPTTIVSSYSFLHDGLALFVHLNKNLH
jgi:hypothetical protein